MKINKLLQLLRDNAQARADGELLIRVDATGPEAHIYLDDVIDQYWGASAAGLIAALVSAGDKPVKLHINTPGGDVFEGLAMAAAITAHPQPITACIAGVCASAGTGVALACAEVRMTDGSLFMVHESWTLAYGNKGELRKTAALLEKIDTGICSTYAKRTGATAEQVVAWVEAETWFTAAEAKDAGFITAIDPASQQDGAQAAFKRWNLSAYANAPKPTEPPAPDAAALAALAATQLSANRNRMRLLATT